MREYTPPTDSPQDVTLPSQARREIRFGTHAAPPYLVGDMAKRIEKSVRALRELSIHFMAYLMEEGARGRRVDRVVASFSRRRAEIISGVLGTAGLAGGAWAALSVWSGSLGVWGSAAISLGVISSPMWIPVAGGVAGLTAAGSAAAGIMALSRRRGKKRQLRSIIGLSKMLILGEVFEDEDERVMRSFLRARQVPETQIRELLQTTPETALELARSTLSRTDRQEVARYIFPLVYSGDGVISPGDRRRFKHVCAELRLAPEAARTISRDYRERLEAQWTYLKILIGHLNNFAEAMAFDSREMELLHRELTQLTGFDPRRVAAQKRHRALAQVGRASARSTIGDGAMDEAAVMGAYALAQTATDKPRQRRQLGVYFDELVAQQDRCSPGRKKKLVESRKKVDQLYDTTRKDLAARP